MKSEIYVSVMCVFVIVWNLTAVTIEHRWSAQTVALIATGMCIALLAVKPLLNMQAKALENCRRIIKAQRENIMRLEARAIKSMFTQDGTRGLN